MFTLILLKSFNMWLYLWSMILNWNKFIHITLIIFNSSRLCSYDVSISAFIYFLNILQLAFDNIDNLIAVLLFRKCNIFLRNFLFYWAIPLQRFIWLNWTYSWNCQLSIILNINYVLNLVFVSFYRFFLIVITI